MEPSDLSFTLGYTSSDPAIFSPEPFTEPKHDQILEQMRALATHVEFVNRKPIRLTCQVGTNRIRHSGRVPNASLRNQMIELARLGAADMLTMHHVVQGTIGVFNQQIDQFVKTFDRKVPRSSVWTVDIVDMRMIEIRPGHTRHVGALIRTLEGVQVSMPRLPDHMPMADWANEYMRDLAIAHATQILARHGRAALC